MNPTMRAFIATYCLAACGAWSVLFHATDTALIVPQTIFYAVLCMNTYFSIRFFSAFTPASLFQRALDGVLLCSYLMLAVSLGTSILFPYCVVVIFTLAPIKYVHMLGKTPYDRTVRKKIAIDLAGTLLGVCVLGIALTGSAQASAWTLAILFLLANVYLMLVRPMYRHE